MPRALRSHLQEHRTTDLQKALRSEIVSAHCAQVSERGLRVVDDRRPEIGVAKFLQYLQRNLQGISEKGKGHVAPLVYAPQTFQTSHHLTRKKSWPRRFVKNQLSDAIRNESGC